MLVAPTVRQLDVDEAQPHPLVVVQTALAIRLPFRRCLHGPRLAGLCIGTALPDARAALLPLHDRRRSPEVCSPKSPVRSRHLSALSIGTDGAYSNTEVLRDFGSGPPLSTHVDRHLDILPHGHVRSARPVTTEPTVSLRGDTGH